ncbi:MAG TPA: HNH endonuclease signature motif containing protein, partial [Chitinophagales bacterium]|nr:HNH endonuclease signature motif containing protein [Chitinophagales bacterium]
NASNISIVNEPDTFYHLRDKLKNLDVKPVKTKVANIVEYRIRSLQIKKYALERAMGICEYCQNTAPFIDSNGIPFLEVHHIHKLADDGPDIPINVGAICPNCHREAHYGINKTRINEKLITIIKTKEDGLD